MDVLRIRHVEICTVVVAMGDLQCMARFCDEAAESTQPEVAGTGRESKAPVDEVMGGREA